MITILLIHPLVFINTLAGTEEIRDAVNSALGTGNSARLVRGLVLPLSCGLIWIAKKIADRIIKKEKLWKYSAIIGIVAGISFVWSNDFGISCWICLALMTFVVVFSTKRKFIISIKHTLIELVVSFITLFIVVEITTFGHFNNWANATFGTGGYQQWYYNSEKSYYLWDIDTSFAVLLQVGLCIYYLTKMISARWQTPKKRIKDIVLAYINMVCVCAVQEYRLLSGGNNREYALSVLFLTIMFELIYYIAQNIDHVKAKHIAFVISVIFSTAWLISSIKNEIVFYNLTDRDGVYVEQMDGYMKGLLGDSLLKTDEFLNGEEFFATYASAQEVVSGTWQPSGSDYIIHVLGDSQRDNYLRAFHAQNYRYVATIKETYTDWEYWIQRANWFLYRNIYKNWHPVFANAYELYWEKNKGGECNTITSGFDIRLEELDDATNKVIVQCENAVNGIADVYIDYKVCNRRNKSSLFNIQKNLKVENTGTVYATQGVQYESNYLRSESAEYIPIPIINGYGEVTLSANPGKSAYLKLNDYRCEVIFAVTSDYLEFANIENLDNVSVISIPNTEKYKNAISGGNSVIYKDDTYNIREINQDDTYIYIKVDGIISPAVENIIKLSR